MNRPIHAVLLGTAVGDSLGLPAENLSARQIQRRWPGPWRHRFVKPPASPRGGGVR